MSDFDLSPRSCKRRKTSAYAARSSPKASAAPPSVLSPLSHAVTGVSRRLFRPKETKVTAENQRQATVGPIDSAYGSSAESLRDQGNTEDPNTNLQAIDGKTNSKSESQNGRENEPAGQDVIVASALKVVMNKDPAWESPTRGSDNEVTLEDYVSRVIASGSSKSPRSRRLLRSSTAQAQSSTVADSTSPSRIASVQLPVQPTSQDAVAEMVPSFTSSKGGRKFSKNSSAGPEMTQSDQVQDVAVAELPLVNEPAFIRSGGRQRRRTKRFSNDSVEPLGHKHSKKSSPSTPLTAVKGSTKDLGGLDEEESRFGQQLGFRDIPRVVKEGKGKGNKPAEPQGHVGFDHSSVQNTSHESLEDVEDAVADVSMPDMTDPSQLVDNTSSVVPNAEEEEHSVKVAKTVVLSRLSGRALVPLRNLATEYGKVHSLLSATVTAGEGNSMLILGSRGSGKSTLIETVIADLTREYAADFHVVRLNGFRLTDDKLALREIWRQLGKEMLVDEGETNQVSSYADTMASLLHLLSHPEEITGVADPEGTTTTTKSVIFILDEFDLFATHPRQTLLYNLFDIAQSRKAPVAVVGCSTRVDVMDMLEKRVKSRFSHRWIHLAQAKSLRSFEDIVKAAMRVEGSARAGIEDISGERWNCYIESTFLPCASVQSLIRQFFYTSKSVPSLFSALYISVACITTLDDLPTSLATSKAISSLEPPDHVLRLIASLPHLHLFMLVCAARLEAIHNASVINFNLAYHHYVELASRARIQSSASGALALSGGTKIWGREVARGVWEELGGCGLLVSAVTVKAKGQEPVETRMYRVEVTLEEIGACLWGVSAGVRDVLGKWCKEI